MNRQVFQRVYPQEFGHAHLAAGVRVDGRAFDDARKVRCSVGAVGEVVGSAMVKVGATTVVAGVSALCSKKENNGGTLVVELEVLQLASEGLRHIRDRERLAAPVLSFVAGVLSDSRCGPDLADLAAATSTPAGQLSWDLTLRLYVVDLDGNLADAALLAARAGLANLRLPKVNVGTMTVDSKEDLRALSLPWRDPPVSVSFALVQTHQPSEPPLLLLDPSKQEEELADNAKITVLLSPGSGNVFAVNKAGGRPVSAATIQEAVRLAKTRAPLLDETLRTIDKTEFR